MDRNSDLTQLKKGYLHQKRELAEDSAQNICPCLEFENSYELYTNEDKKNEVVTGKESSSIFCRWCPCTTRIRPFTMNWSKGNDVKFTTERPFRCDRCFNCTPCCLAKVHTSQRGAKLGHVQEDCFTCVTPRYTLYNEQGVPYARIRGPTLCFGGLLEACGPTKFTLEETNGRPLVDVVNKKKLNDSSFESFAFNTLGDSDDYHILFPDDATDQEKANIISALVLLDYQFFEGDKTTVQGGCYLGTCYCGGCVCPCVFNPNDNSDAVFTGTKTYDF